MPPHTAAQPARLRYRHEGGPTARPGSPEKGVFMKPGILLTPALLSLALTGVSVASFAAVLPKTSSAILRATAVVGTQFPVGSVETTSSVPLQGTTWPDAAPPVVGAYVATVLNISGTPCFDCVNGHTKGTFGEGYPLGYVNTNTSALGVLLEWFDVSYKGSCTVTVTLSMAGKTLKSASGSVSPTVGGVENSEMGVTRGSAWHGAAAMTGKVVCGATTLEEKGTVYFQ